MSTETSRRTNGSRLAELLVINVHFYCPAPRLLCVYYFYLLGDLFECHVPDATNTSFWSSELLVFFFLPR